MTSEQGTLNLSANDKHEDSVAITASKKISNDDDNDDLSDDSPSSIAEEYDDFGDNDGEQSIDLNVDETKHFESEQITKKDDLVKHKMW